MSLSPGFYEIVNGPFAVGRLPVEELSLLLKPILKLPQGVQTPKWVVQPAEGGGYLLRTKEAPTANIDGNAVALLVNEENAEKWKLERVAHMGNNFFTISTNAGDAGWIAPSAPQEPIACRPLIVLPTETPQYPPNEVFQFIPVTM